MVSDLIRVVLADDHNVVRTGLKAVLGTAKDIDVVGEAKDGREALTLIERFKPDVVVMDLAMTGMDGLAATQEIVAKELPTKVLVLTMHEEEEFLMPVLKAGAAGYLVKSAADRALSIAIGELPFWVLSILSKYTSVPLGSTIAIAIVKLFFRASAIAAVAAFLAISMVTGVPYCSV